MKVLDPSLQKPFVTQAVEGNKSFKATGTEITELNCFLCSMMRPLSHGERNEAMKKY